LAKNDRFILTDNITKIDDELLIFSDVKGVFSTKSNNVLLKKTESGYINDDFLHEQNLIVTTGGKSVLLSGCSHKGIANILCTAKNHQPIINAVIGGFHLYNPATKSTDPPETIHHLANELSAHDVVFYTGHCTGRKAFEIMRDSLGDKLQYFSTGTIIDV